MADRYTIRLQPGDTVLDVGTGDGLIGFGALDRLGPSGHVAVSDISQDLLDHCHEAATAEGLLGRCSDLVRHAQDAGFAEVALELRVSVKTRGLVRFALMLVGDQATAEDVVQEAFLGLDRAWDRVRDPDAVLSYLRTAVVNGTAHLINPATRTRTTLQLHGSLAYGPRCPPS